MRTVKIEDVTGVKFNGGTSYRTVLERDGLGFAMMMTCIEKGGAYKWHYKNHQEACMCISGHGFIEDLTNGEISEIEEGVTYLVDNNQPHLFTAKTSVVLVSVFNPPLTGQETHDKDGSYNLDNGYYNDKAARIVECVNESTNNYDATECVAKILKTK